MIGHLYTLLFVGGVTTAPSIDPGWLGGGAWPKFKKPARKWVEDEEPEIEEVQPAIVERVASKLKPVEFKQDFTAYVEQLKAEITRAEVARVERATLEQQQRMAEIDNEVQMLLDERAAIAAQILEEIDITYIAALMAEM